MSRLCDISAEIMRLMDMLDDPEIEVDEQAFQDTWEALRGEFDDKVEGWLKAIKAKQVDCDARDAWIEEQKAKNEAEKKSIDWMKRFLIQTMQANGIKTAGTAIIKATVAGNGGKVPLKWAPGYKDEWEKLPEQYRNEKTVYSANQDEIRKALDAGEKLNFVEYGERGVHLNIK